MALLDSDIIVDISAHQSCFQIMLNEGDITIHRLPGGDPSDPSPQFVVEDVPDPFGVFDELSYEIAKLNVCLFASKVIVCIYEFVWLWFVHV